MIAGMAGTRKMQPMGNPKMANDENLAEILDRQTACKMSMGQRCRAKVTGYDLRLQCSRAATAYGVVERRGMGGSGGH